MQTPQFAAHRLVAVSGICRQRARSAPRALRWSHANGSAPVGSAERAARKGARMLPTVDPRTRRTFPAAGVAQRQSAEQESERPIERRRAERPAGRQRPVTTVRRQPIAAARDTTAPVSAAALDDTPLLRMRQAMSHHQVDAILVVGRDDGTPLRWVTRDGLVRETRREPSRQGARQAIGDAVAQLNAGTSLAQLRELLREPDVSRVLIWCNSGPLAIVSADELFTHTVTDRSGSAGGARLRRAPRRSTATPAIALAGHGRRLLGLVARAQPDASGWTSEAQLESMVPGGRLEWRVLALEALTAAGLLDRVQRSGQFDYRLTRNGLELADAHKAPGSSDPGSRPSAAKSR
jgi:hypothetical protein